MSEPTSTEKTTKSDAAPAEKAGKKKSSARDMLRESGKVKKVKPVRESRPKKEKAPKGPPPVVFAFRLSEADRHKIHDASGSARASRFVLAAALAAADGDVEAFKKVVASRATK